MSRLAILVAMVVTLAPRPAMAGVTCAADCDGDGAVSIDELILAVSIALALASVNRCPVADLDADGTVRIGEIIAAVSASLSGCTPEPVLIPGNRAACGCTVETCEDCPPGRNCVVGTPIQLGCATLCRVTTSPCRCAAPYRGTNFVAYTGGCGPACEDLIDCGRPPDTAP
jgi:hypothetical protein